MSEQDKRTTFGEMSKVVKVAGLRLSCYHTMFGDDGQTFYIAYQQTGFLKYFYSSLYIFADQDCCASGGACERLQRSKWHFIKEYIQLYAQTPR